LCCQFWLNQTNNFMKKYYVLLTGTMLLAFLQTRAQTKIGGAGAPDGSAMLEVTGGTGNNKGILPPRLTTAQRDAINLPAKALMIYNTTTNQLQVNTGTPVAPIWSVATQANAWSTLGNAGTDPVSNYIGTADGQPLIIRTDATERMRVQSTGNIGIATNFPQQTLHVQGTARITGNSGTPTAITGRNAAGDIGNVSLGTGLNLAGGVLSTPLGWDLAGNTGSDPNINYIGTADGQPLIIRTDATERMRVQSTGNIGIATNFPQQTLHVEGTARVTGSAGTPTAITGRNATGDIGNITLGSNLSLSGGVLNATASASGWGLTGNAGINPASNYIGTSDAQPLVLRTNGTEQVRIDAIGHMGLGTNAPVSQLDIRSADFGAYNGLRLMDNGGANATDATMTPGYDLTTPNDSSFTFDLYGISGYWIFGDHIIPGVSNLNLGREDRRWSNYYGVNADISGTARIQGSTGTPTAITGRDAAGNINNITLGANLSLAGGVLSASGVGGTSGWALSGNAGSDPNINYVGTADGQPLIFRTNATERMRMQSTGNIGINTNDPQRTLHVQGGVRITGSFGTPTAIMGRDGAGDINNLTLGTGLTLTGGVLSASPATSGWALSGNAGSDPNINYVGTADGQPLIFRTNATERMRMQSTGNIGIGTNNPAVMLDVDSGDVALTQTHKLIWGADSDERIFAYRDIGYPGANLFLESRENIGFIIDRNNTASVSNTVGFIWATNTSWLDGIPQELMRLTDAGNLGLGIAAPAYRMDVAGDINASSTVRAGGVVLTSDARLKRNISNTQKGLSTIMKLNPVEYEKKNTIQDSVYDRHEIGFIAQEVAKVLPSLVTEGKDADKTLAVSYTELIPVLTKAIQEQQAKIESQDQKINALVAENATLKESKAVTAQLMERVKQMEQMMGINEIEGTSKVAGR
jgi:hypothetical protein